MWEQIFFSSRTVKKVCFHSTLWACFSSRLHRPEYPLISLHGCPWCTAGTVRTHRGAVVISVGPRCQAHKSLQVISCSYSGTHFCTAQNRLRMDYGLTVNYGVATNDSLILLQSHISHGISET